MRPGFTVKILLKSYIRNLRFEIMNSASREAPSGTSSFVELEEIDYLLTHIALRATVGVGRYDGI